MNISKAIDPSIVTQENPLVDETALKKQQPLWTWILFFEI